MTDDDLRELLDLLRDRQDDLQHTPDQTEYGRGKAMGLKVAADKLERLIDE